MKRATAIGFAQALAAAATVDEVDGVIRSGLAPLVEASGAILGIVDRDAGVLRLRLSDLIDTEIGRRYETLPLGDAGPFTVVVEEQRTLVLRGEGDWGAHAAPEVVADAMAVGLITMACAPLVGAGGDVVATLAVAWDHEIEVDEATSAIIATAAELCEQTLERARATDQASHRASALAGLAELLADAMTVREALEAVAVSGNAPVGAAATSIGLIDHIDGVLRTHHGSSVHAMVRDRWADPPLTERLVLTDSARLNEMILVPDHESYVAQYPQSADTAVVLGRGARAAVPIRASSGEAIGSIVHAWAGPRTFDNALVSALTTIAEMAGQAIERAQLVEQIQLDAARHEALAGLGELLASARTSTEIAEVVANHAADLVGAASANLVLVDIDHGVLTLHHSPSTPTDVRERYLTLPLDAEIPHADALRSGTLLVFKDLDEMRSGYPHLLDDFKAAGRQACAIAPLTDGAGGHLGAIGFSWNEPIQADPTLRARVIDVAYLCAQALGRARLSDAEHRLVTTLQDNVLTSLPAMEGLDLAARYLPAARHIGMGGDWYDGIDLGDGRYAVVVGDVAGHGITAVGDMAQLKAVIGALVRLGTPLGEVYRQTTALLRQGDRTVTATALIAVIDTRHDSLAFAAAGHPPPVLRRPDGTAIELGDGRQPLLGVLTEGVENIATHPFPAGSTLLLYTDGLVERRRELIDDSITRLADLVADLTAQDAEAVASGLLDSCLRSNDEPEDDVALVVIHRT